MTSAESVTTYGIVGVGLMGIEHINNLLAIPNSQVTCVADPHPPSIQSCLQLFQEKSPSSLSSLQTFTTAIDLLRAHICDVVIIATPNHTHYSVLLETFEHAPHVHILVEKPLCTTIEHCREVLERAKAHHGHVYVGLEYAYMPPIAKIIQESKQGTVGRLHMVHIREHRFPFLVKVNNWNRFSKNSGGTFVEKCCHFFDLFCRILSPQMPESVYASGAQDVNHLDEVYDGEKSDILDNGFVVINFSGGARACLDLCMFAEASRSQEEVCIVGDKGKMEAFLPQMEVRIGLRKRDKCGEVKGMVVRDERVRYEGHHHGSSFLEHLDFLKVINGGMGGNSGLGMGLISVAVGVAAHKSLVEERVVQMTEILNEGEISASVGVGAELN